LTDLKLETVFQRFLFVGPHDDPLESPHCAGLGMFP